MLSYLITSGWATIGLSGLMITVLGAVIASARSHSRDCSTGRAAAETYAILALVCAIIVVCVWFTR